MKNIIYALTLLFVSSVVAQKQPTEVKQETKVKIVKTNNGEETLEKKVKVITKETANVKLDKTDENKVNQDRVFATKKVEKMLLVDDDKDSEYDILAKDTYFSYGDNIYRFIPNKQGFDIIFNNKKKKFVTTGKAYKTKSPGSYLVRGETYNGIGYFDIDGNFIVDYYDEEAKRIKTMKFDEKKNAM